jgi:hypothetical protein
MHDLTRRPATVARALLLVLVAASLVALVGCRAQKTASLSPPAAQALRTCVDRWNEGHMVSWGPALVSVGFRRLDATRLAAVGLRPGPRRCVVSVAFEYRRDPHTGCSGGSKAPGKRGFCVDTGTWSCVMYSSGAYGCPLRHEPDRVPLTHKNATTDEHGVMTLDVPLAGTHAPPRLAWQRYPRTDGWIEPWTRSGRLRPGLRFTSTYTGGGSCSRGSEESWSKSAGRCLWRGLYQVDPCFAQRDDWDHRGAVLACSHGPEAMTFGRFVIGPPSYRAIDFPDLVPWTGVGAFQLGESRAQVAHDYDAVGHRYHAQGGAQGYYVLHGSRLYVGYRDGRLNELDFTTRFYRTWKGFGVGSRIPPGPCHRTARAPCEHRWHGFVWNAWATDKPCSCWVKVGEGKRSLPATGANFLKPWVFIYVRHGRVTRFHLAQKFVD